MMLMRLLVRIDPSPPKPVPSLPRTSPPGPPAATLSPSRTNGVNGRPAPPPQRGSFQPMKVPTQPRSSIPQSRPPSAPNASERQTASSAPQPSLIEEPVVVLEEETDPEKVLEERRRKREEIMAKFRANGGKPPVVVASPAPGDPAALGTGVDSVGSAGVRTGFRTGVTSATGV